MTNDYTTLITVEMKKTYAKAEGFLYNTVTLVGFTQEGVEVSGFNKVGEAMTKIVPVGYFWKKSIRNEWPAQLTRQINKANGELAKAMQNNDRWEIKAATEWMDHLEKTMMHCSLAG